MTRDEALRLADAHLWLWGAPHPGMARRIADLVLDVERATATRCAEIARTDAVPLNGDGFRCDHGCAERIQAKILSEFRLEEK